ncbi:MAG: hypothetical protein KOO63_13160 [Bacteroidales bacterium]|nr:hypothetical protein [Candidatus Latescibacterota bacterium]
MRRLIIIAVIIILFPFVNTHALSFPEGGLETHIGGNTGIYAPWHHKTIAYGYGLSLVMRPSYAKYMYDELERFNLGLAILSTTQYVSEGFAFRDVALSLRYYFNRGEFGPGWESGFVGAGIGIATVSWSGEGSSGSLKDKDYVFEAGYEFDLNNSFSLPLVVMFHINLRVIDIEPVSYTGMGASIGICYGVGE